MFDGKIKRGPYLCRAPAINQNTQVVIDLQVIEIFEGVLAVSVGFLERLM